MNGLIELFPFSLTVNPLLQVQCWGPSLPKLAPLGWCSGANLQEFLVLERPWCQELSADFLMESRRQGQIWRLREGELRFRGQTTLQPGGELFLALTPIFHSLAQWEACGLGLDDLGGLDQSLEFLLQAQLQEVAMEDSNRLRRALQAKNYELTRQRKELETAQEIAQLGSFEGPLQGPYVVSRNLCRLLNIAFQDRLALADLLAAYPDDSAQKLRELWEQSGTVALELNGSWHRWIQCRTIDRITGTIQDISLQKQSEHQLLQAKLLAEQANQAKSDFLAMMSHEIRTPMNGVLGLTELLLNQVCEPELREMLDLIRCSGQGLLVILNDILDYSRIESGQMPVESCLLELRPKLRNIQQLFLPQAERQGVHLEFQIHPNVPRWLVTDPTRLQQVISNLLGNALKFTRQGEVVCQVDYRASFLEVNIRDTGIGIAPERLGQLFQPFVQAEASTTRRYGGTGLGLSICQRLCRLMGGGIEAESVLGQGSSFRFWIAASEGQGPASEGPASSMPELNFAADLRVLVAEDNLVNRRVLLGMLGRLGLSATVVENGLLGLTECRKSFFDLMILDVEMPEMDGLELIRRVRAGEAGDPNRDAYIVSLTAQARELDQRLCLDAGANGFLSKPVSLVQLQQALRHLAIKPGPADEGFPYYAWPA